MIRRKIFNNSTGFTLIEILISLTIISILIMFVLSYLNQAYSYTKMNQNKTVGINVARNVLYYIEQQDFSLLKQKYFSTSDITNKPIELTMVNCDDTVISGSTQKNVFDSNVCKGFFSTKINNIEFDTVIYMTRHEKLENFVIPVEVTVSWGNQTASVKGLIKND